MISCMISARFRCALAIFIFAAFPFSNLNSTFAAARRCERLFEPRAAPALRQVHVETSSIIVDGRTVYFEHIRAAPGFPTAIEFTGLWTPIADAKTHENHLAEFQMEFAKQSRGEGLILFVYSSQIESLVAGANMKNRSNTKSPEIELNDLVRQATGVINAAGVRVPVSVIGYSYGSAPAARFAEFHKGRVNNLIFVGPLMESGDFSPEVLAQKRMVEHMAGFNPFLGPSMIQTMRDAAAKETSEKQVKANLAVDELPKGLKLEEVIAAVYGQMRAVETFKLLDDDVTRWPRTSFVIGSDENPSRFAIQQQLVAKVAAMSARAGTVTILEKTGHAAQGMNPSQSAAAILKVMRAP